MVEEEEENRFWFAACLASPQKEYLIVIINIISRGRRQPGNQPQEPFSAAQEPLLLLCLCFRIKFQDQDHDDVDFKESLTKASTEAQGIPAAVSQ